MYNKSHLNSIRLELNASTPDTPVCDPLGAQNDQRIDSPEDIITAINLI